MTWQIFTTAASSCRTTNARWPRRSKSRSSIRGKIAIAMRPDGSRLAFSPYPTPLFDDDGQLTGAVNMLIDVSDEQGASAERPGKPLPPPGRATLDPEASHILGSMARGYETTASALRGEV